MASVIVRNLDDDVKARLQTRARAMVIRWKRSCALC